MFKLIRPLLFLFKPEFIHKVTFKIIKFGLSITPINWLCKKIFSINDKRLERDIIGLKFPNPVGLAAGFDKDADLFDELSSFGFGFIEIGTVTPLPQSGNPQPRLFRIKKDSALINRMGFNNDGLETVISRLRRKKTNIIIGGNIGKNKLTPNELATSDYEICFEKLFNYVDYFTVNVSSPNTPGLRELQQKDTLKSLLKRMQEINSLKDIRKPILLKIAPDLTNKQLDDIITIVCDTKIDGVIATNTTIERENLITNKGVITRIGNGGLSGKPLKQRSTEVIRYISENSNNKFPIIAVGGIHTVEDALEKLNAGASLIQLYTGFIYEGPSLIKNINKELLKK